MDIGEIIGLNESEDLLSFLLRIMAMYVIIVLAVRLSGKRGIGEATALDLILAVAVGDTIGQAAYGDQNTLKWVIIVAIWIGLHALVSILDIKIPKIGEIVGGRKTLVIRDGVIMKKALHRELVSEEELMMLLRNQSVEDLSQVRIAYLEPDGRLSVFKKGPT